MKKLLFTLMALFVAFAANATTLYIVGGGTVDGKSLPGSPNGNCVAVESVGNVVTFTVKGSSWLKISDTNASDWATFNKNGFTIEGKGDYAIKASELGQSFKLWWSNGSNEGTNNITPPSTDEYVYTITLGNKGSSNTTLVVTAKGDVEIPPAQIYARGLGGNWDNLNESIELETTDGNIYTLSGVTIDTPFKIADAGWGAINYGYNGQLPFNQTTKLTYNADNINVAGQPITEATITFNLADETILVTGNASGSTEVDPFGGWYVNLGGEFNGDDFYNGGVQPVDGVATFTNQSIGNKGFKIKVWEGGGDDKYYIADGPQSIPTDEWVQFANDAYDVQVYIKDAPANGVYTVQYNVENNTIYVEQTGGDDPVSDIPENLYLIGTLIPEGTWNPEGQEFNNEGDNMFTIENVAIYPSAGDTLGYFGFTGVTSADWDTVNGARYGALKNDDLIDASAGEVETTFVKGTNAWSLEPGIYNLYVAFDEMSLTVEYVDALPSGGNFPETLYFAQPFGTIPADAPQTLTAVSDGVYEGQILIKTGMNTIGFYTDVNGEITKYGKGSYGSIGFGNTGIEGWPGEDTDADNTLQVNPTSTFSWYMMSKPGWAPDGIFTMTVDLNTLTFTLAPPAGEIEEQGPEALYIYGNTGGYTSLGRYTNVVTLEKQGTANVYSCKYDVPACGPFTPDNEYGPVDGAPNNGWYFLISDNRTSYTASGAKVYQAPTDNFLVSLQQGGVFTATVNADKSGLPFILTNPGNYSFEFDFDTKEINITLNEVAAAISLSAEVPQANVTGKTAQLNWSYEVYNASSLTNTMLNVSLENVEGGNEQQVSEEITGRSGSILLANLKDGITYRAQITVSATAGGKQVVSNVYTLQFTTPEIEEVTEAYLGVTSDGTFPAEPDKSKGMELSWRPYSGDASVQLYSFSGTFTLYPGQGVNIWGPSSIMTEDPDVPNPFPGLQPMGPDWDEPQDLFFKTGATEVSGKLYPTLSSYWVVKNTIPVEVTIQYDQETGLTLTCNTDVSDQVEGGSGEVPDNNGMKVFIAQALRDPSGAAYGNDGATSPSADDVQLAYVESEGVYYGYATFANANNLGYNRSWRVYTAEEAGVVINYYTGEKATEFGGANLTFASVDAVVEQNMVVPKDAKAGYSWTIQANSGFPTADQHIGTVYMVIDLNNMTAKFSLSPFQFATPEPAPEVSLQPSASDGSGTPNQSGDVDNEARTITLQTTSSTAYVYLEGVPEGATVYFKLDNVGDIASGAMALAIEGYVLAEQTTTDSGETEWRIPLTAGTQGDLSVYYELESGVETDPVQYSFIVTKTTPTGVDGINAEEDGAEYFTLQGVKVQNPEKGIYIRVLNGKADKVVL